MRVVRALPILLRARPRARAAQLEAEIHAAIDAGARLADLAALAARALDEAAQAAIDRAPELAPACAPGCSSCCHVHVDASVPEILAAAAYVERALSADARRALRDRLAARVAEAHALDDVARWRARVPCALLDDDGRCAIHEARPLRCRAFHSRSSDPCRAALAGDADAEPALIPAIVRATSAVEEAYDRALDAAGIGDAAYRFEAGLVIALDAVDAETRVRAGEDVFACARARPTPE